MQTPVPTSKRRLTSAARCLQAAARGAERFRSTLILLCGIAAVAAWQSATAEQPPKPLYPFSVTEYDSGSTWTYVTMDGGDIGVVDLNEIRDGDISTVVELLQRHGEWTGAGESLELATINVRRRSVTLTQLVHGIRVDNVIDIRTDEGGNVTRLTSAIVHPEAISNLPTILEGDAVAIAQEALRNHLAQSNSVVHIRRNEFAQPKLYLDPQPDLNGPVRFYWTMHMRALGSGDTYAVTVDAHSGDSDVTQR